MIRSLLFCILMVAAAVGLVWYSAQALPDWYEDSPRQTDLPMPNMGEQNATQAAGELLGNKLAKLMRGQLVLNQTEFNALLHASLLSSPDGRDLLRVSDAVNAELNDGRIEFGVILNLDKLARHHPELQEPAKKILEALPLLDKSRVSLAVNGQPIARDGSLALAPDLNMKIGSIPISSNVMLRLGLPGFENSRALLPLKYMSISSVEMADGEITLHGVPRL